MAGRKKAIHQPFEGKSERGQFAKICADMMSSDAWKSLNLRQRGLYLELKAKYRQKVTNGILESSNRDRIEFPRSKINELYGDFRTFKGDMAALTKYGFVCRVSSGKCTRTPNIYSLSDAWKDVSGQKRQRRMAATATDDAER